MQKVSLPADSSCARQPIAAEARRDISNALIENEIARAPAILSGPSKTVCCCRACFFVAPPHTCVTLHQLYSMNFAMYPNKPSIQLPQKFMMSLYDVRSVCCQTFYKITSEIHDDLKRSLGTIVI